MEREKQSTWINIITNGVNGICFDRFVMEKLTSGWICARQIICCVPDSHTPNYQHLRTKAHSHHYQCEKAIMVTTHHLDWYLTFFMPHQETFNNINAKSAQFFLVVFFLLAKMSNFTLLLNFKIKTQWEKLQIEFIAHPVEQKWLPWKIPTSRISDSCCVFFNLIFFLNCFRLFAFSALYKHNETLILHLNTNVRRIEQSLYTEFSLLHGAQKFYHQPQN